MENQRTQKQWWTPVWRGLVMDAEAKHYRAMKSAVWLYLYLLLNANRKTGILFRKIETVCHGMGVTRDTALRWLKILRRGGYIKTVNTGHSLTIQVTRRKALSGAGKTQPHKSDVSNSRYGKYPTPLVPESAQISLYFAAKPGISGPPNDTNTNKLLNNDTRFMPHAIAHGPHDEAFKSIGFYARQELLAWELARTLDDPEGINLYRSYSAKYPEWLLRKVLAEVQDRPQERITKGRGALFNYLVQHYAKGVTENPGD